MEIEIMTTREVMQQQQGAVINLDDGFGGYKGEIEGDFGDEQLNSLLEGCLRIKFGKDNRHTVNGDPLPKDFQALAVKTVRAKLKWHPDKSLPPSHWVLAPNEKWPDIVALNNDAPKSEWITGPDGKPCGPYQRQSVLYLMGLPAATERYVFAGTANRDHASVEQLALTIKWRRQSTGKIIYPVVGFSDVLWSKRYALQRAYFVPMRWIEPNTGGGETLASDTIKTIGATAAPAIDDDELGLKTVAEPTLKDDLKDTIPY